MILHLDMDAFFAAVEQRDNPGLRNKPIVVCGHSKRAVVSTASYEARQFGIRSAMPLFQAKQRCRHLLVVPGNMKKYAATSRKIMEIMSRFTPLVEPVSIDEAYADITGCQSLFGPPETLARKIKRDIYDGLSLTCSIGIAPVKFLAKIASDMNKPNGLTLISPDQVDDVISQLPIGKVPGVGRRAMQQMEALQIRTLGDVKKFDPALLSRKFGKFGERLCQLSSGLDASRVEPGSARKSISSETTLSEDISDIRAARDILLAHARRVGRDLRRKNLVCRGVTIKIKFSDFSQITRSCKTRTPVCTSREIFTHAVGLLEKVAIKKKMRLLGVGVTHLSDSRTPVQMDLFQPQGEPVQKQWESVDRAVDSISEKFGNHIIAPAVLTTRDKRR